MATELDVSITILKYIVGFIDPDVPVLSVERILNGLSITNETEIVESAFKHISHAIIAQTHCAVFEQDTDIYSAIIAVNNIIGNDPTVIGMLANAQLRIDSNQLGLEKFQIPLPKKKPGTFKRVSGMLMRHAHMLATEVPSAFAAGGLSLWAKSDWDPKNENLITDSNKTPILFIHGLKHNQSGWAIGAHFLKQHDSRDSRDSQNNILGSSFYISYDKTFSNSWNKMIDDFVAIISGKVCEIRAKTGHKQVIFVCHSLGSLIGSRYAETHSDVKNVITIGAPFQGSHIASLIKSQKEKYGMQQRDIDNELAIGSESLLQIYKQACRSDWEGKIRYYNIRSTTDELVPKESTVVTKDPRRLFTLESTGHLGLLFMPKVWKKVYEWLTEIYSK